MSARFQGFESLTAILERSYRRLGAIDQGVLVAISGGADSTALLIGTAALTKQLGRVEAACLDHGLRAEAADEVESVRALAGLLGVPFHTQRLELVSGPGLEERARDARYSALEVLRAKAGLGLIATAHTASDQAETLLMRLARGASLRGAAGIRARRGRLVRPMLEVTRPEIERVLTAAGVRWRRTR
jgi:tRNA(Ile)-lysidine synthase